MNPTTVILAFAALLLTAPAVAADGPADGAPTGAAEDQEPCDAFYYSVNPPGYKLDLSCIIRIP